MIRRARRVREVAFSFDSFLDLVTNVVGIIIRLILVVWVGARSYSSLQTLPKPAAAASATNSEVHALEDPLQLELAQHERELAEAQARLLEQLRLLELTEGQEKEVESKFIALDSRRSELQREGSDLDRAAQEKGSAAKTAALSFAELQQRQQRLSEEIRALEKLPPLKKTLRYRTPVSRPVQSEELLFECRAGRVTFVDVSTMLAEVKEVLEEKAKLLRNSWVVTDRTRPAGAFRLHYTLERQRETLDAVFADAPPSAHANFSYGLSEWEAEPVAPIRGETAPAALAKGSEFRLLVDALDPQQAVVTMWVYPDSFALYRQLRDYLYERDITVAGRPLPDGVPITCSRRGSRSRGQ